MDYSYLTDETDIDFVNTNIIVGFDSDSDVFIDSNNWYSVEKTSGGK